MKKTLWAKALVIVAVFFTTACSRNTPPVASEGAKGGIFSYSPREIPTDGEKLLSVALVIRGEHPPSLSEVRRMEREMVEKIPEGNERADFELALTDIKDIIMACDLNYFEGNFEGVAGDIITRNFSGSPPENMPSLIRAFRVAKKTEEELSYALILPGMKASGCFFTESDRARFGKYLGW